MLRAGRTVEELPLYLRTVQRSGHPHTLAILVSAREDVRIGRANRKQHPGEDPTAARSKGGLTLLAHAVVVGEQALGLTHHLDGVLDEGGDRAAPFGGRTSS